MTSGAGSVTTDGEGRPAPLVEQPITALQEALASGRTTSVALVSEYLHRIALYDGMLHATLAVNRRALDEAADRDRERAAGYVRGPLHGIPIALKDNIQTLEMPTTGGALAFDRFVAPYESTVARRLRDAGAIIIAKTGMTELANWVAGGPTPMPTNYNALHGFGVNPYDPRRDPRPGADGRPVLATGGSSSGIGTAASLWAANIGTETSGSILSPSNQTMLAGLKPTVGRISRYGIIPITADQDTPGPMARSVRDLAVLLSVLEGGGADPQDPATARCTPGGDYAAALRPDALRGARIGIPRAYYYDPVVSGGTRDPRGGLTDAQRAVMREAIEVLRQQGASIVDPADVPSVLAARPEDNLLDWSICADESPTAPASCSLVLQYGMKRDFARWLASLGSHAPVPSLTALRAWNEAHRAAGAIRYGQSLLDRSDEIDLVRDAERYQRDRATDLRLAGAQGIDAALRAHQLDALLFPGPTGASLAARPGYPTVIVPFGFVPNAPGRPFPAGFDARPAPFGVSFTGTACSEPRLLALAYAFEQATRRRVPPAATP